MLGINSYLNTENIKTYALEGRGEMVQTYSRKDYYKISLLSGRGVIHYGARTFKINGSVLLLCKPGTVCKWQLVSNEQSSFTSVFTEDFLDGSCFNWVAGSELFSSGPAPVFNLNNEQIRFVTFIFRKMISEQNSSYYFINDLMQNHIGLLLHAILQMKPNVQCINAEAAAKTSNALFVELVEMQFSPVAQVVHFN